MTLQEQINSINFSGNNGFISDKFAKNNAPIDIPIVAFIIGAYILCKSSFDIPFISLLNSSQLLFVAPLF